MADFISTGKLSLVAVRFFVLDEAVSSTSHYSAKSERAIKYLGEYCEMFERLFLLSAALTHLCLWQ